MQHVRRFFQGFFFLAAVILTARNLAGMTKATVESYCPAGGLESILFYLKNNAFLCATSGINLILFLAVLGGTIIMGRAFCSWVCPVGTVMEFLRFAGTKARLARLEFWKGPFGVIGWLRYPLLGAILYFTLFYLDLVFRKFCPYYVVFSGQEHEIEWWSKWVMISLAWIALVIPFFWCRVICPLGAVLGLARLASPLAPRIRESNCTTCGACDRACPQQIPILEQKRVVSADCTQCLACQDACPQRCIEIGIGYRRHVPAEGPRKRWRALNPRVLPVAVALMMIGGLVFAVRYPLPTFTKQFPLYFAGRTLAPVDLIVKGLRCRGTAGTLAWILEQDDGIAAFDAYVSEHRAHILYDPSKTSPQDIRQVIDAGRSKVDAKTKTTKVINPFRVEIPQEAP